MSATPTTFEAAKPPPHWTAGPTRYRHPTEVDQWDWQKDPVGGRRELAIRRLNWARDLADPRAPDQMALVLRLDLSITLGDLTRQTARADAWKRHAERSDAEIVGLRRQRDELHETTNRYLDRARAAEAREIIMGRGLRAIAKPEFGIGFRGLRGIARRALESLRSKSNSDI